MVPKFRVWNKIDSEYTDEINAVMSLDGSHIWWDIHDSGEMEYEDNPDNYELEQSTGLKDVNGKEIYENDLIRLTDDLEDPIYKVIFDEDKFEIIGGGVCYDLGEEFMDCEVIGDIHNNPELLKADK
ncbi:YopX family protein [Levilactobacillus brevis]|nr:YopX family protein [Levilactobacillus brevis]